MNEGRNSKAALAKGGIARRQRQPRLDGLFICAHAVRLTDGQVMVRLLHRGDKEACESLAERGVEYDAAEIGDVEEECMIVRPASEWDAAMEMSAAAEEEAGRAH